MIINEKNKNCAKTRAESLKDKNNINKHISVLNNAHLKRKKTSEILLQQYRCSSLWGSAKNFSSATFQEHT